MTLWTAYNCFCTQLAYSGRVWGPFRGLPTTNQRITWTLAQRRCWLMFGPLYREPLICKRSETQGCVDWNKCVAFSHGFVSRVSLKSTTIGSACAWRGCVVVFLMPRISQDFLKTPENWSPFQNAIITSSCSLESLKPCLCLMVWEWIHFCLLIKVVGNYQYLMVSKFRQRKRHRNIFRNQLE